MADPGDLAATVGDPVGDSPGFPLFGAGHGFSGYPALAGMLGDRLAGFDAGLLPHAREVALIGATGFAAGRTVAPEDAQPVYLRDEVAHRR